jgi:hypothetical protein
MKYAYIRNYNRFVSLIWLFIFGVFWLQYLGAMSILEAFMLAACVILSSYPVTTGTGAYFPFFRIFQHKKWDMV